MEQSKFYQIKNVTEHEYNLVGCDGSVITRPIRDIDKSASVFTIKDAKDGDVLIDEDVNVIGIFEGIEGMCWHSKFYYSNTTKEFYGIEYGGSHQKEFAKPATKEQRDTLMKAMADAGWEFDFEKKELKKISQRMVSAEAKEALYDKPAWSEEDETMTTNIIIMLKEGASLHFNKNDIAKGVDWLKSLRPQSHWKPSEKQMNAFEQVYDWYNNNFAPSETLTSLYNDLKKLREEY